MKRYDRKTRNDILLIIFLCMTAVTMGYFLYFGNDSDGDIRQICITVDGEIVGTYKFGTDEYMDYKTIPIDTGNTVIIEDGQVYMKEADCPDGLCVKQGSISKVGESIICLPHKLVVRIESVSDGYESGNTDELDVMPR